MLSKIYHENSEYNLYLILLLGKFIYNMEKYKIKKIYQMIKHNKEDEHIINYISKNFSRNETKYYESTKRAENISNILYYFLNNTTAQKTHIKSNVIEKRIEKYLDVGCNNGSITVKFGKKMNLNEDSIYGIDVEMFTQQKIIPVKGFNFTYYDGYHMPFSDNYFDLITCRMVLHHVEHLEKIINEICRVIKLNGLLIIKEHDVCSFLVEWLTYIEHMLYDVTEYQIKYEDFIKTYKQYTFSKDELIKLLNKYGFELLKITDEHIIKKYPTRHYYIMFKKTFISK